MKKCPRCGYEVDEQTQYCPHCGLDLKSNYRQIKPKNKPMVYLMTVILFFSLFLLPTMYTRLLDSLDQNETMEKQIELKEMTNKEPTAVIAFYDNLEDFQNQFSNVDPIVNDLSAYQSGPIDFPYTFEKTYQIMILNNYNIYYKVTSTAQINENVTITIDREFDRAYSYNFEKIMVKRDGANNFNELFLTSEEMTSVKSLTGEQVVIDQLIDAFSKRQEEFDMKKKKLGHYGIGNYDGQSSFVAYRRGESYYSRLTYFHNVQEKIQ